MHLYWLEYNVLIIEVIVSVEFCDAQRCAQCLTLLGTAGSEWLMFYIPDSAARARGYSYFKCIYILTWQTAVQGFVMCGGMHNSLLCWLLKGLSGLHFEFPSVLHTRAALATLNMYIFEFNIHTCRVLQCAEACAIPCITDHWRVRENHLSHSPECCTDTRLKCFGTYITLNIINTCANFCVVQRPAQQMATLLATTPPWTWDAP